MDVAYPFIPRSNARLAAGQFWALPLSDGRFGCGRVLAVAREPDPAFHVSTRAFLAGLMDWVSDRPPTSDGLAGARLRAQGFVHVKAIQATGGEVLGIRALELDAIQPTLWRTTASDHDPWVYQDIVRLRRAEAADSSLPIIQHWGFKLIERFAEHAFVGSHIAR